MKDKKLPLYPQPLGRSWILGELNACHKHKYDKQILTQRGQK